MPARRSEINEMDFTLPDEVHDTRPQEQTFRDMFQRVRAFEGSAVLKALKARSALASVMFDRAAATPENAFLYRRKAKIHQIFQ